MKKLSNGTYNVKIAYVNEGQSEHKNIPYMLCGFECEGRIYEHRIYLSGNSLKFIKLLYYKAGINSKKYDGYELIGAELGIEIISGSYVREGGGYVTFPKLGKLYSCIEMREMEMANCELYEREEVYCEDRFDSVDSFNETDMAEIFGVSLSDVAKDMRKDPSQISDSDIMEYCGY